jgi:hypothetical protein
VDIKIQRTYPCGCIQFGNYCWIILLLICC